MKHPVELYPDFNSLSVQLRNIETLADRLGIDVDDLLIEPFENTSSMKSIGRMRKSLLKKKGMRLTDSML